MFERVPKRAPKKTLFSATVSQLQPYVRLKLNSPELPMMISAQAQTIMSIISSRPAFSNLTQYLESHPEVDLVAKLSTLTDNTLLAPDNEASPSSAMIQLEPAFLANDTSLIEALLSYHIPNGTHT